MATEISLNLINELRISLRRESKLSSYDPSGDYSDSSFPAVAEAIAEIDASSSPYDLRCRNCKGRLLRGIESLKCVFCGKQQRTSDNPPDPIKFTSTCAYEWFLKSQNLDGSEMVEPLKETNISRRERAKAVKGIAVSKFLDLEIQWSAGEEDEFMTSGYGDGQSINFLNLGGICVDDYSGVDLAEDEFRDPRSLSLFDSVKIQGVVESQQSENVGLFKEKDENLSLFTGRDALDSVSLAEHGNFAFFEEKEDAHRCIFSKNDDTFGFFEGKDAQRKSSSKEDENFGLFESTPSSNAGLESFDGEVVAASSDWDSKFQSDSQENVSVDPFKSSQIDLAAHIDSVFSSGKDLLCEKPAVSKTGDWLQDDLFGNVAGKTQNNDLVAVHDKNEGQVAGGNGSSSMDVYRIGDDIWQTSEKKAMTPDHDGDDEWNGFANSANSKTPNNVKVEQEEVKGMPSVTSTLERTSDPAGIDQAGTSTESAVSESDIAKELMSQMRDLSFMLDTKLSLPPLSKTE